MVLTSRLPTFGETGEQYNREVHGCNRFSEKIFGLKPRMDTNKHELRPGGSATEALFNHLTDLTHLTNARSRITHGKRRCFAKTGFDAENMDNVRAIGGGVLALRVDSVRCEPDPDTSFQEICLRADPAQRAEHCLRGKRRLWPGPGMSLLSVVQHHAERRRATCKRKRLSIATARRLEPIGTGLV